MENYFLTYFRGILNTEDTQKKGATVWLLGPTEAETASDLGIRGAGKAFFLWHVSSGSCLPRLKVEVLIII